MLINQIFSVKNKDVHKIITVLGIKLKYKSKKLVDRKKNAELYNKSNDKIDKLNENINILNQSVNNLIKSTDNQFNAANDLINSEVSKLNNQIKLLTQPLFEYTLKSKYEYERCKEFYNDIDKTTYINKYKNLIKNLDDESVSCVSKILNRIELVNNKNVPIDIFDDGEKKQIAKVKKDFSQNIIKLDDECFAYKQYLLPIRHFEPSVFYYKHDIDKIKNINFIKDKNIIDVGGYIGDSAIVLKDYTDKKIYSFEPTNHNYNLMLKTIELNNQQERIIPVKRALGSKEESLEINLQDSGSSINRIIAENPAKEVINVTTLDKFVKENNIKIGLIKVDIEGFEQEFIKGAVNTIKEQKPVLLLSIYHFAKDFFDIKPMIESLNLGYEYTIVKPVDGSVRGEILLICEL